MALVLSGGLFRNAFQVGVLEALHERGFRPDLVIGVSSGAWNGACLVADQLDQMRSFWQAVARLPKLSLKNLRTNRTIFNIRSIIEAIPEAHLGFDAIARSRTRLFVDATRVKDFTFRLLELNGRSDTEIFAGLLASNLIPGLVGWPVKVGGQRFVDGGSTDRVPYEAAIRAGARRPVGPHLEADYGLCPLVTVSRTIPRCASLAPTLGPAASDVFAQPGAPALTPDGSRPRRSPCRAGTRCARRADRDWRRTARLPRA